MPQEKDKWWWLEYVLEATATGSTYICEPPVMDTDHDCICLIDQEVAVRFAEALLEDGWKMGGSKYYGGKPHPLLAFPSAQQMRSRTGEVFHSWKKDKINLILTASEEYYSNFVKATNLAKFLNLLKKEDRVALFEAVTSDKWPMYYNLIVK